MIPTPLLPRPAGRALILCLGVVLSLAACSTTPSVEPVSSAAPLAETGAPLPTEGYDWHFNADETEASLAYGMAETDDVPLDLSCTPGQPHLTLLLNTDKGAPHQIQLESGGDMDTYPAQAEASPLDDSLDLTATASAQDPVFVRFRQTGWLALHLGKERRPLVATQEGRAGIKSFFDLCNRGK